MKNKHNNFLIFTHSFSLKLEQPHLWSHGDIKDKSLSFSFYFYSKK